MALLKKDATKTFNLILHFVDLIRHFNKLPVLETACGHSYESRNSRFSESNDVKMRISTHQRSTVSGLSTGDGSIMATRRCLHWTLCSASAGANIGTGTRGCHSE